MPIWAENGRLGGYTLDRERTLPPLALTAEEALAIAVALRSVDGSPFAATARSAALKVLAGLPADVRRIEAALAERVHRVGHDDTPAGHRGELLDAIARRRVVHLGYADARGAATERDVEPLGLLWGPAGWYLLGWCRLRDGVRGFLLDRFAARSRDRMRGRPLRCAPATCERGERHGHRRRRPARLHLGRHPVRRHGQDRHRRQRPPRRARRRDWTFVGPHDARPDVEGSGTADLVALVAAERGVRVHREPVLDVRRQTAACLWDGGVELLVVRDGAVARRTSIGA